MRSLKFVVMPAVLALALTACGKEKSVEEQRQEAMADMRAVTDKMKNLSSDPERAATELQALAKAMEEKAARHDGEQSEPAADVCAFLAPADVEALIGAPATKESMKRIGSSWGGCNYGPSNLDVKSLGKARFLMVNIRPANEFEATVDYQRKKGGVSAVAELDGKAYVDGKSLLWQAPGKPWFVYVSGGPMGSQDAAFAVDAARRMKL
jgi:hypothetical protein